MDWDILFSDLNFGEAEQKAVAAVVASEWLTMGARVAEFESALSDRLAGHEVIAVSSGTAALHLALMAWGLRPDEEVILPSMTFVALANVTSLMGARPVFVDIISVEEPVLDPARVAEALSSQTRVISPMHYAGAPCPMEDLLDMARATSHPLAILEDAAHGFGGRDASGAPLGTVGNMGAFSFFSNKNLPVGEGGALTVADAELAHRLRRLRCHGVDVGTWDRHRSGVRMYDVLEWGLNYRMPELAAALGLAQLERFESHQQRRAELYAAYVDQLSGSPSVTIPFQNRPPQGHERHAFHIFPILAPDETARNRLANAMNEARIQTSLHYRPIHQMRAYQNGNTPSLPVTEEYARRVLTLPLHPRLKEADVERIVSVIKKTLG